MQTAGRAERLYGLDWLRIGAFALLILYHIGMFFVPWEWHVKTARPVEWLELPMLAVNPWRLLLLFVISGYASRVLLARMRSSGGFARVRSSRLLIPLLAGMAVFVVPQPWAELRVKGVISSSLWQFWTTDYFGFHVLGGVELPTWNHLWFVAYLWVYTMLLALLACAPARIRTRLQSAFERLFSGWRLFVLPMLLLFAARQWLHPLFGETHALIDDVYAHTVYGFGFFFGAGLFGAARVWEPVLHRWRAALIGAAAAFAIIVLLDLTIPGESGELELLARRAARSVQAWGAIVGLLGFARTRLDFDHPARAYLTEAIFPYYIAHQTIVVATGYALLPLALGAGAEFMIILGATLLGCFATYEVARRVSWLRPVLGLRPATRNSAAGNSSSEELRARAN